MILDTATKKLEILLGGAPAANQLPFVASWADITTSAFTPGSTDGATNSGTPVDLVPAPAASTQRVVKAINVYNADTASATVTIRYNNNSTLRSVVVLAIAPGDSIRWSPDNGWQVVTNTGATKVTSAIVWGGITGTLAAQTDLDTALDGKAAAYHNHQAGLDSEPTITEGTGGDAGKFSVASGDAWFFDDTTMESMSAHTIAASGYLSPTDDATGYVCADRDTNSWVILYDAADIDYLRYIPYFVVFKRAGSNNAHFQKIEIRARGEVEQHHSRVLHCARYDREAAALESISVDSSLNIVVSGGGVWAGNHRYEIPAVSPSCRQFKCENNGGGAWTIASNTTPVVNNTQYNGATAYVTLTDTYWTVNYLYRGIEDQDHIYSVLGTAEYATSALAQASSAVPSVPGMISSHCVFVGRVIIQKNATTGIICESAFSTVFAASSAVTDHGALAGLADDDHAQYHNDTRGDARYPTKNSAITPGTATKITYDAKGLVTAGEAATTADVNDSADRRYCTDAQKTVIGNTSGTNSGDSATPAETGATIATLHHAASVKSALVDADEVTGGDSAASFGLIRSTWTSIKAFLKTYFDTLYPSGSGTSTNTNTGDETGARIAALNHAASAKSALVDADEITGQDSAASFGLIRSTWTNVKAFLKTYFDAIYAPIAGTMYIGTTATTLNRGSGAQTLAGLTLTTPVIGAATGTSLAATAGITSSGGGIGYATGAGGTVTQSTSRTTGVTLSKLCGNITMFSAAQAAQALVTFTVTNTFIAATDYLAVRHISATNGGAWNISTVCGAGSATINIRNVTTASITEATPLRFTVIKGVTA